MMKWPKWKGLVFNIERFAIHDGPGIRTLIFLKGCPLRCKWCCNPEGILSQPEIMYYEKLCDGCQRCVSVCPQQAIQFRKNRIYIDRTKCQSCGQCIEVCAQGALKITGKFVTVDEVMKVIIKDIPFYKRSEGGVTLSGGEPLLQASFSRSILNRCHEENINTAMETSAFAKTEVFLKIIEYVDLLFVDLKHMKSDRHRWGTGRGNKSILDNIRQADKLGKSIIIRIPLIPRFNLSKENIELVGEFVASLKHCRQIQLLPYHTYGIGKYETLAREYPMGDAKELRRAQVESIKNRLKQFYRRVQIGG